MKCPDCDKELIAVIRQVEMDTVCDLDHDHKTIKPQTFPECGDTAYRCPHCDSLNVEEMLEDYEFITELEDVKKGLEFGLESDVMKVAVLEAQIALRYLRT